MPSKDLIQYQHGDKNKGRCNKSSDDNTQGCPYKENQLNAWEQEQWQKDKNLQ